MRMFDVQGIEINAASAKVFDFVSNPANLPRWTQAFTHVDNGRARLSTEGGHMEIELDVASDADTGTIDWRLEFPDGTVGLAQSRVTPTARGSSIFSFVLHAPPVALEQVEGALEKQRITLQSELQTLKSLMER